MLALLWLCVCLCSLSAGGVGPASRRDRGADRGEGDASVIDVRGTRVRLRSASLTPKALSQGARKPSRDLEEEANRNDSVIGESRHKSLRRWRVHGGDQRRGEVERRRRADRKAAAADRQTGLGRTLAAWANSRPREGREEQTGFLRTVLKDLYREKKRLLDKGEEEDDDEDEEDEDEDEEDEDEDEDEEEEEEEEEEEKEEENDLAGNSTVNGTIFPTSLPKHCLPSLGQIICRSAGMFYLPTINDMSVTTLDLADNNISEIAPQGFSGLSNLERVDLSKNKLEDSSLRPQLFSNATKLMRLNLDGNSLTEIPPLPPSLEELKMNYNKLSQLNPHSFQGLVYLLSLELVGNGLYDGIVSPLTFQPLRSLFYLRLDSNRFSTISFNLPPSLQELWVRDNLLNEVQEMVFNKSDQLRVLDLSHNQIRENYIAPEAWIHLPKLEALDLSSNLLAEVPRFLPTALRRLALHQNQIERIPARVFSHLRPGLSSLRLSHNRLGAEGIQGVSFMGVYPSLAELLLDHNQLQRIPMSLLPFRNLQLLHLNNNHIRSVPPRAVCSARLKRMSPLRSLHLEQNHIDLRLVPPAAFSCLHDPHSVILEPQSPS